jgi:hypothetical protein
MKTKNLLTIALAVAMIVMPLGIIQSARAAEPRDTPLVVTVDLPVYYTTATIGGTSHTVHVESGDKTVKIGDVEYTIDGTNLKLEGNVVGALSGGRQEVKTEDDVAVKVTLSGTNEPVNNATVSWAGLEGTTDAFGGFTFTAPFRESEKNYGPVEAIKVYKQEGIERSAYGASAYDIVVVPYDLSNPEELLAWWGHFALTAEAQDMYAVSEILGDWGANLGTEGVTVWSNIFGPKGGSLAKFIRGFPQFMVDRGAAMEATKNMLSTIWALFTLLPALVLAMPQLLQTAPMRMLQFWPALFINLDIVLDGISQMVIDLGVFMTSLGPSVLMLMPELFAKIPAAVPRIMSTAVMTLQAILQIIPAVAQYLPASIAALPAFGTQMLQAMFYNAPAIIDVLMSESFSTIKNLFRSWPMFPIGVITGLLAVAPAIMLLPAYPVYSLLGHSLEAFTSSLSGYMQDFREMPSQLLESVLGVFRVPGFALNFVIGIAWAGFFSIWFWPVLFMSAIGILLALFPAILLFISIVMVPVTAIAMVLFPPLSWLLDFVLGLWMILSAAAAWLVTVPSTLGDMISEFFKRATQVFELIGYPIGWILDGINQITGELGGVEGKMGDLAGVFESIIGSGEGQVNLEQIVSALAGMIKLFGATAETGTDVAKGLAEIAAVPLPG